MTRREAGNWLRGQAAASRPATLRLLALGLAGVGLGVAQAAAAGMLIGPVLVGREVPHPLPWALLFAAAAGLRAVLGFLSDRLGFEAGAAARRRLRTRFLVGAMAAGPHGAAGEGAGTAVAVDQVEALDGYFARWLPSSLLAVGGPVLVLAAAAPVDPVAAAIMLAGGLAVPLGMALAGIGAAAAAQKQFESMERLQSRFLDRVRGLATIVMAGQAEAEAERLRAAATELSARTFRVLRVAFLSSAALDAAAAAVLVTLALRAGADWRDGTLEPAAAVFTLLLVNEFFAPLRLFAAGYQDRLRAASAATLLGGAPSPPDAEASPAIRNVSASGVTVAFEKVGFTWDPARGEVLRELSFRVPAGETALLVGPSGSGKSTVIELLLGFVQAQAGRVTLNGVDLRTVTPAALSRMTAWIGQHPVIFAASIRDNIRFGREGASDDEVDAAVRAAGLHEVAAALPLGLDTVVGEGGYGLSGGQTQRVAIARAVLRNAPLLLLDEPTAHLDPATEADVLDGLRRLCVGRTVILASHSSAAGSFAGRRIELGAGAAGGGATQGVA